MSYQENYKKWCTDPYFDAQTQEELKNLEGNEKEIEDRFYRQLEFGTGGLRGMIGAGTNRMNIYTVRQATQGLANYIIAMNGQDKGVAMLIVEYILRERTKTGTMPENPALVETIVTTDMAKAVAKAYNTALIEILTGFKYIGEQIRLFDETGSHHYVFGFEESYGCLAGTYARDKDAPVAVMMLCEVAAEIISFLEQVKEKKEEVEAESILPVPLTANSYENAKRLTIREISPELLGHYPEEGLERYAKYLPKITDEDMKLISEPIDIYGQNIYNGRCTRMGKDGKPEEVKRYDGFPKTAIDWPVTPEVLYWGPKFLYERYQKPIYITENGMSCHDVVSLDGKVHDPNRIDFLARYLHELKRAAEEIDLRGYFQWSLMDNFEWAKGYSERFGLVYVDFRTQKRILKDSAYWYRDMIQDNGKNL